MNPKILILDIETKPMLVSIWELGKQYVGLDQIEEEWSIIAWSAKWLGEPTSNTRYYDLRNKDVNKDKVILEPLWKLLDEADYVVTQNGKNFDAPKINARFIMNGMQPPSPYKHLDTYQIARRVAKMTSNKLEYLTEKVCKKYKKLKHKKYPGRALWRECCKNNIDAWNEMKKYNIHDVLSTEELYLGIRAWAPAPMTHVYLTETSNRLCPVCNKQALISNGTRANKKGCYRRLRCENCGASTTGEKLK